MQKASCLDFLHVVKKYYLQRESAYAIPIHRLFILDAQTSGTAQSFHWIYSPQEFVGYTNSILHSVLIFRINL